MKNINDHIDEFGFIVSTEPDVASRGGNSAQHSSIYYISEGLSYHKIWYILDKDGEPRLHWSAWPSDKGHMSRDNLTCCVCALKLNKMYPELRSLFIRIIMHAGFLWNTKKIGSNEKNFPDFCGPLMFLVATRFKYNPLNILSDLYLWASIYIQLQNTARDKTHTDGHINLIVIAETCRRISDNLLLSQILKWYKNTNVPQYAARDYFDQEYSPPLHQYLIKIVESWQEEGRLDQST